MHPDKANRETTLKLTDLPNVGPAMKTLLNDAGIVSPDELAGKDPYRLYMTLNEKAGKVYDPCVLDVFISVVYFMNSGAANVWWAYTPARKKRLL